MQSKFRKTVVQIIVDKDPAGRKDHCHPEVARLRIARLAADIAGIVGCTAHIGQDTRFHDRTQQGLGSVLDLLVAGSLALDHLDILLFRHNCCLLARHQGLDYPGHGLLESADRRIYAPEVSVEI